MPRKYKEGQRFGRLVIKEPYVSKNSKWCHLLVCDCGGEVVVAGADLTKGNVRSCGCIRRERFLKHGLAKSSEYKIWCSMVQRCRNEKSTAYAYYGGRGITICDRWSDFEKFYQDMGERPSDKHSIDRIDNDKGYSPDNCRWADAGIQNINQRLRKDNKTGVKGVSIKGGKYQANINHKGKRYYLGVFDCLEKAIAARMAAEKTFRGSQNG